MPFDHLIFACGPGAHICVKLTEPDVGSVWDADMDRAVHDLGDSPDDDVTAGLQLQIMKKLTGTLREFLSSYPDSCPAPPVPLGS